MKEDQIKEVLSKLAIGEKSPIDHIITVSRTSEEGFSVIDSGLEIFNLDFNGALKLVSGSIALRMGGDAKREFLDSFPKLIDTMQLGNRTFYQYLTYKNGVPVITHKVTEKVEGGDEIELIQADNIIDVFSAL